MGVKTGLLTQTLRVAYARTMISTCVSYAEARNSYRLDVRPSVRPSHASTLSKRLNILS